MKRTLSLILVLMLLGGVAAGCSKETDNVGSSTPTPPSSTSTVAPGGDEPAGPGYETGSFPLVDEPKTYTIFSMLDTADTTIQTYAETYYTQQMAKLTNVDFEWHQQAGAILTESFNLMIASNDYDDVIRGFSQYYTRGVDDAIEQGIILPLEDFKDYFPNMMSRLQVSDEHMRCALSDSGHLWSMYCILTEEQGPWGGSIARTDLLKKYGYDTLITFEDWEEFLTLCRDNEGMTDGPLGLSTLGSSFLQSIHAGFNVTSSYNPFMNKNGKVVCSILEDGFKEYITLMADWYAKGLILKDFYTDPTAYFGGGIANFANGRVSIGESTYDLSPYRLSLPEGMTVGPVPYPVKQKGDVPHVRQSQQIVRVSLGDSFSTSCSTEDVKILCRYYDYMYTDEGVLLANWGTENYTFVYDENGNPQYTDLIMANPDGLSFLGANVHYLGARNMPGLYEWTRELTDKEALDCINTWYNADDDWVYPENASMTMEEGNEYATIWGDISTLVQENIVSFIIGARPMSEFDAFIDQLKGMNIERCIEIKQASLDRYFDRLD